MIHNHSGINWNGRTICSSFVLLLMRRFRIGLFLRNTILFFIVPMHVVVTLVMLLSEDGGKIEQENHGDANPLPSQELGKIVNGTKKVPATLDDYRKLVVPVIEEYYSTGDVELAVSELRSLGSDQFHNYFVKKLISMAMDRHDKEKEMSSILMSALYADLLDSSKMSEGFMMLLESTEDLSVDIPDAVDVLAVFVARAIVDEILPPVFLTRARALLPESSKGIEVLQVAEKSYLSAPHHAELVERMWGGSTHFTVEEVKKRIQDILREYIESGDTDEAFRCIRELGLPFFHHEVVKRALILGMENLSSQPLILKLLKESTTGCLISSNQVSKGFSRAAESVDDLSLDVPSAKTLFDKLLSAAISEGWLDASFCKSAAPDEDMWNASSEKVKRFKEESDHIIQEYFLSDDVPELIRSLQELSAPEYNAMFLKKLITLAMDRKNREKEMASVLLSSLSLELFSTGDIMKGFIMLLQSAEDTALDIVGAPRTRSPTTRCSPRCAGTAGSRMPGSCSTRWSAPARAASLTPTPTQCSFPGTAGSGRGPGAGRPPGEGSTRPAGCSGGWGRRGWSLTL
uniref:MI domain-containing protein n=1 Tax=Hordeum vulgare subsp. vulgare TaxID=112509 RepID=A0A8I7BFG6_HORVV